MYTKLGIYLIQKVKSTQRLMLFKATLLGT